MLPEWAEFISYYVTFNFFFANILRFYLKFCLAFIVTIILLSDWNLHLVTPKSSRDHPEVRLNREPEVTEVTE